ncbi:MAG: phosphoribosylaminoimidazolesuccinocarboxamide synthase [Acidobacteria bacterium]|nr:phosphoribosylaminoimidazolesuccinocarboxamide synthase [Acidobacteriota bacterium]
MSLLIESHLPGVKLLRRGKVRDVYEITPTQLLMVATDRVSAFDVILGSGIPDKGRVLTQLSLFWFDFLRDVVPNHVISADVDEFPEPLQQFRDQLEGRSMFIHLAKMVDVECVARGYLSGSGWKEYQQSGTICGIPLPAGLRDGDRLPSPIFTPATKATTGHDENIPFEHVVESVGIKLATQLRDLTLKIYDRAAAYAETRGIILADTKFEFGYVDGRLVVADEVLTSDSSRFWPRTTYKPGGPQPSYDKQYVRDYLETLDWNKQAPGPELPDEVVAKTGEKYVEAYRVLTGKKL